jgi:hypothetical protein
MPDATGSHVISLIVNAEYVKLRAASDSGTSNQIAASGHDIALYTVQFNWYENVALIRGLRDALSTGASPTALPTDRSKE